jgi:mannose/fructose/N-acetylgalactosamine-specific phosphotransferase system component IIC
MLPSLTHRLFVQALEQDDAAALDTLVGSVTTAVTALSANTGGAPEQFLALAVRIGVLSLFLSCLLKKLSLVLPTH